MPMEIVLLSKSCRAMLELLLLKPYWPKTFIQSVTHYPASAEIVAILS